MCWWMLGLVCYVMLCCVDGFFFSRRREEEILGAWRRLAGTLSMVYIFPIPVQKKKNKKTKNSTCVEAKRADCCLVEATTCKAFIWSGRT